MVNFLKYFKIDEGASALIEFSLLLFLFLSLLLVALDMMLYIVQRADLQRAHAVMGEAVKNRIPPIVAAGYDGTWTPANTFVTAYCSNIIFKYLCKNININIYPENAIFITSSDLGNSYTGQKFCYASGMYTCTYGLSQQITDPLNNDHHHIIFNVQAYPFAFIRFNSSGLKVSPAIATTSIVVLNN